MYTLTLSNYFLWNTVASKQCFIAQLSMYSFQSIHFVSEMVDLPAKKKKRQSGLPMSSRNAVGLLNELRTGVEFTLVAQTGPVHCPVFTMAVTVRYRNFQLFTLRFQWESDWFTEACHGTSMDTFYEWSCINLVGWISRVKRHRMSPRPFLIDEVSGYVTYTQTSNTKYLFIYGNNCSSFCFSTV